MWHIPVNHHMSITIVPSYPNLIPITGNERRRAIKMTNYKEEEGMKSLGSKSYAYYFW